MARFDYFDRLSAKDKKTYAKSDAAPRIDLPFASALAPLVKDLEVALAAEKRLATARASNALTAAICTQLGVEVVKVTVRAIRPSFEGGELHGLYTYSTGEKAAKIEVWMRTVAHQRVVRFRTFLRTLLHEVCHHLDVTLLRLEDSFHTEGFFRRESSLMRQLVGAPPPPQKPIAPKPIKPAKPVQLDLFKAR